ncbi:regulatory protein RecX [Motilimonas sp. KMU-193]|uniref:regulatory protein RecX n=1 Tax=Motilimonas sp. KMU-193 TaxID=3388668 RepID=UPI00396B29B2
MNRSWIDRSDASYNQVYQALINLVSRREHSRLEIKQKLLQKEYPSQLIEQAISHCCECDYINDARYCASFIRIKANKGFGLGRLTMELKQKGISAEQIQQALDELALDWYQIAQQCYQKKYGDKQIDDYKERQKRQRYLFSRGFDSDQVRFAVAQHQSS